MIKMIVKDIQFLGQKSEIATPDDMQVAVGLMDTLAANTNICVGLAANMIGVKKRVIVFDDNGVHTIMFNPEIMESSGLFQTKESCLSLVGERETKRYQTIKVKFMVTIQNPLQVLNDFL